MSLNLTKHGYTKLHSYLSTLLRSGTHEIVFQKVNGDIRVLQGTLDSAVLTEELGSEYHGTNPHLVQVLKQFQYSIKHPLDGAHSN